MIHNRNPLTYELRIIKVGVGKLQDRKFCGLLLLSLVLVGISSLPFAISPLLSVTTIKSSGQILAQTITARSGHWRDIKDAVDQVAAMGGGNVYIPEGEYNFVNTDETWRPGTNGKVTVPAGVSIFGAPTERYANGSVIEWKTKLLIAKEFSPSGNRDNYCLMFRFLGTGDPNKPIRVSDIEFVGYRMIDHTSDRWYSTMRIWNIIDFRVDHCFFNNMAGMCVDVRAPANGDCCGVIDHCKFVNNWGYVEWSHVECSVIYAICIRAIGTTRWEDDITNVIGHYTPYTVFIEDCYFSRWRHCVCSLDGTHYVFRHNIIEKDSVVGSLDGHGTYDYVGTRAIEIYDNQIIDPISNMHSQNWDSTTPVDWHDEGIGINWRGGGGIVYNNIIRGYKLGLTMTDEGEVQKCYPHDVWIWNNTWVNVQSPISTTYQGHYNIRENVDYFLRAPNQEQDGFEYTPYPYPHPLTIEES